MPGVMMNSNGRKKVHITTLGCSKNLYDSEILMGQILRSGATLIEEPRQADVIILNTCGFITPAKQESIQAVLEAGQLKKENSNLQVIVCGCLSTRYSQSLIKEIPEVDAYFGTEDYSRILKFLNIPINETGHLYEERYPSGKKHYAYLKISEGCNHKCAFCAIPLMRGRHRSRSFEDIIHEAEILAEKKVKEVILIAQDTTFYGLDLYNRQRIIELLNRLEKINGIEWIRIHYAYPTTFQPSLIDLIQNSDKIVHYLDLPIQHISDKMLKIMKRGGSSGKIKNILNLLREKIPDVVLRTTLLVGHPGETENDFRKLKNFVEEFKFDRLGVFKYSPEENTPAFKLKAPAEKVAEERYGELMALQQKISYQKNMEKRNKIFKVLIDEIDRVKNVAVGRTYGDSPEIDNDVIIENPPQNVFEGKFYNVKIVDTLEYELFGQILE
jgi:ribosomal protein S12 methylthiotransferase